MQAAAVAIVRLPRGTPVASYMLCLNSVADPPRSTSSWWILFACFIWTALSSAPEVHIVDGSICLSWLRTDHYFLGVLSSVICDRLICSYDRLRMRPRVDSYMLDVSLSGEVESHVTRIQRLRKIAGSRIACFGNA